MKIVKLKNNNVKLVAEKGKVIQSKATHIDEETNEAVPNVKGPVVYLGKNDSSENYVEIDAEEES